MNDLKSFRDVDISQFVVKDPVQNKKGGMNAYINQNAATRESPKFQLADHMRCPFGVNDSGINGEGKDNPRKNLEVSCDDEAVVKFINELDEHILDMAVENSEVWFGKKLSREALSETVFRRSLTINKEGRYAPTLRLKVNLSGYAQTKVCVVQENRGGTVHYAQGTLHDITPNSHCTPVVTLGGVWMVSRGFGITYNCPYILVYPNRKEESDFPFIGVQGVPAAGPRDIDMHPGEFGGADSKDADDEDKEISLMGGAATDLADGDAL